MSKPKYLKYG